MSSLWDSWQHSPVEVSEFSCSINLKSARASLKNYIQKNKFSRSLILSRSITVSNLTLIDLGQMLFIEPFHLFRGLERFSNQTQRGGLENSQKRPPPGNSMEERSPSRGSRM
jgi:hypothetical protein